MSDFSMDTPNKSSMQDRLIYLFVVARNLENAGVRIISAEASITRGDDILFYSATVREFREWAKAHNLEVTVTYHDDSCSGLNWRVGTTVNGIAIFAYLTDREKESYDAEAEA